MPTDAPGAPAARRPTIQALWRAVADRNGPIWLLNVALLVAALALLPELEPAPLPTPLVLPWWVLAVGFFVAEVAVVHYDYRRESHSFSMNELPLVFGLFFAAPHDLVLGAVVGVGGALLVHRRQNALKLVFNAGHVALGTCLAVVVFDAVAAGDRSFVASSWLAVLLATVVTSALSSVAITIAISLSERRLELGKLPEQLALALLTTVGSASFGLMGVGVAWQDPTAAWLLLVPVATFFVAYRGYVLKRQERNSLEFLYSCSRIVDESPDAVTGLGAMLSRACKMFRADFAQVALVGQHDGALAVVLTATADSVHVAQRVGLEGISGVLHSALQSSRPQTLRLDPAVVGPDGHTVHDAMIAPLRTDARSLGALLVGNRLGAAGAFGRNDLRLIQALVTQISMSLENGRLTRSLNETAQRADRERANALVLQRGILPPPLPHVPGVSIAVRYAPGGAELEVGGDWYDVMQLPSGDVGAAIGDVVGHDLEAAARMGQARSALRAYATEGHSPAALMQRLNRLLTQTDADFMGTCCYLQLGSRRNTVTLVSAGHPPPLLIDAEGRSRTIDVAPNLPLGVDEDARYSETTLVMPRGATLVLYTDGLVESRTLPLDVGLEHITQVPARTGRGDLEELAEHFMDRVAPRECGDDLTLLLLRNEGTVLRAAL